MKPRVFLDTNVFVYAFEFEDSNSRLIIEMLNDGEIEAVVSGRVLREVMRYFKRFHGRALVGMFRDYILQSCTVVFADDLRVAMRRLRGKIKDKDLEQLAAARALGLRHLVSYDRHFEPFKEYITPGAFVESTGRKARPGEF
jgi:predicted nucleic acid-binding protein